MQLGAINTAIPSFKSNVITSQNEIDEMVSSLQTLDDSFSKVAKSKKDGDKKNLNQKGDSQSPKPFKNPYIIDFKWDDRER